MDDAPFKTCLLTELNVTYQPYYQLVFLNFLM